MGSKTKTKKTDILETLGDFTSKENWDNFFTIRPDSFEWYAEWPNLRDPLISLLQTLTPSSPPSSLQLLVPGCGNSRLSEHLYDAGYTSITNVDFSKVVISNMLRRNIRSRPLMRWRVMDMTSMQFEDEAFGAVVDKGGLDALMEPELGPDLGNQYLSEVKRVLKPGGKFVCLTLAESHVLDILFSKFRLGWKMSVDAIPLNSSSKPTLQTFMVVVEKELSTTIYHITSLLRNTSLNCNSEQASGLREALQNENHVREKLSSSSDTLYAVEELQEELTKISQGRRLQLTLGGQGCSVFSYRAVVLDAEEQSDPFTYHCGVFIVPKIRACEWLFFSEEGQWMVVRSSKAARLIMVFLDTSHTLASMDEIQKDLSPLVKQLEPKENSNGAQIPFLMASDGIKKRNIVHQTTSPLTGSIIVEDVVYENADDEISSIFPSRELMFRRLVFERAANLVQSEALLTTKLVGEKKTNSSSKSSNKKRGSQRRNDGAYNQMTVYHGYLASSYHTGIISGFTLISSYMENVASSGKMVKAVIIGLGAGLLPMFLHSCIPVLEIEAVELDPVIVDIARENFSFVEDKRLKVHVADGIQFVRESASSGAAQSRSKSSESPSNGSSTTSHAEDVEATKVDIIIIDVDSSDSSSGLACPALDFLDESFLETVKDKLSEQGLFVVNLVSRSQAIKDMVLSRMKKIFSHLFSLQHDEDVNEIHFALKSESCIEDHCFSEAALKLDKLLKFDHPEIGQKIINATKKIRRLKIYVSDDDILFWKKNAVHPKLAIDSVRDILRVFVNGQLIGTVVGHWVKVVQTLQFQPGYNNLTLLSQTVGLQNYGAFIEKDGAGIRGTIKLTGFESGNIDLSKSLWTYQVGLQGEFLKFYNEENENAEWVELTPDAIPSSFTWYKTYFDVPGGKDPVALDFESMGKGQAWVNGHHIGRYWTRVSPKSGCQEVCDYRGAYDSDKCTTNCGKPTQTLYHVPRSWLKASNNFLVISEETGGNPFGISVKLHSASLVCAQVSESYYPPLQKLVNASLIGQEVSSNEMMPEMHLHCRDGHIISSITFASFGTPEGSCQSFSRGNCHAPSSMSIVSKACLGKKSCSIKISGAVFRDDPCKDVAKTLSVEARCTSPSTDGSFQL